MTSSYALTAQQLRKCLRYSPKTGSFVWRYVLSPRTGRGRVAGTVNSEGYRVIQICGKKYPAHRLAWLWMTGVWPEGVVDHKNCIKSDNRWDNLRDCDRFVNLQNQRQAHLNNGSGFLGVNPSGSRFAARIRVGGRKVYLGTFSTAEEAHAAYVEAKRELHAGCTI